jgi:putative endonuclease
MSRSYYVYILASRSRNLYIGVTNSLKRRILEHREGRVPGFTSRYHIFRLVHFEVFTDIRNAIAREKEIKAWRREKKIRLIRSGNRTWEDLAAEWIAAREKEQALLLAAEKAEAERKAGTECETKSEADTQARSEVKGQETADLSPKCNGGSG